MCVHVFKRAVHLKKRELLLTETFLHLISLVISKVLVLTVFHRDTKMEDLYF